MLVTQFVLENKAENINFREFLIDVNEQHTTLHIKINFTQADWAVLDGSQLICPEQPKQPV